MQQYYRFQGPLAADPRHRELCPKLVVYLPHERPKTLYLLFRPENMPAERSPTPEAWDAARARRAELTFGEDDAGRRHADRGGLVTRAQKEAIVADACGDFRKVLTGLLVGGTVPWRRHRLGLLTKLGKLSTSNDAWTPRAELWSQIVDPAACEPV